MAIDQINQRTPVARPAVPAKATAGASTDRRVSADRMNLSSRAKANAAPAPTRKASHPVLIALGGAAVTGAIAGTLGSLIPVAMSGSGMGPIVNIFLCGLLGLIGGGVLANPIVNLFHRK